MNHTRIVALRTSLLLSMLIAPAAADAQIYDNGAPDGLQGLEMSGFIQADDFTLAQSYKVTGITFWGFQIQEGSYRESIAWRIYANDAGSPDDNNILAAGLWDTPPVNEGPLAVNGSDRLRFDISTDFTLPAGTFWLGLHNGDFDATEVNGFYVETTQEFVPDFIAQYDQAPFGNGDWIDFGLRPAFQIFGQPVREVPEPGHLALTALGLLGLAAARRRWSRR